MCVLCMYKPAAYSGGMTCSMKGKALLDSISVLAVKNRIRCFCFYGNHSISDKGGRLESCIALKSIMWRE